MERDKIHIIDGIAEIEEAAEDLLASKKQITELDKQRQKLREALRALAKDKVNKSVWVWMGNMFIKMPIEKAKISLNKDFEKCDKEINCQRDSMREKLHKLRDLESKEKLTGFDLMPLSKLEVENIQKLLE